MTLKDLSYAAELWENKILLRNCGKIKNLLQNNGKIKFGCGIVGK
jgi:hypothetical protein